MAQHRTFLTPAEREQLLKKILSGEIIEKQPVVAISREPKLEAQQTKKTHEEALAAPETTNTKKELKRIFLTTGFLVILLIVLSIVNAKTPLINQISNKIGSFLAI